MTDETVNEPVDFEPVNPEDDTDGTSDDVSDRLDALEKQVAALNHVTGIVATTEGVPVGVDVTPPEVDNNG